MPARIASLSHCLKISTATITAVVILPGCSQDGMAQAIRELGCEWVVPVKDDVRDNGNGFGAGQPLIKPLSRSWRMLFVLLELMGIASLVVLLALQAGFTGAMAGIALIGLSSLVTARLVKRYPARSVMSSTVAPTSAPGWLKLLNVGVEVWTDTAEWLNGSSPRPSSSSSTASKEAIAILDLVPGMTAAHPRDFKSAIAVARLKDGSTLRTWKNPVGFDHVFLADPNNQMIYGGYVGWIHSSGFQKAIVQIKRELT